MRSRTVRACAVAIVLFGITGCREEILHDLDETRANQALLVLERAKINVKKSRSGTLWTLSVDRSDALRALSTIEESRILARDASRFKEESKGLLQTRDDRLRSAERRLSWDLETTLERIPHVLEAKVHLRIEENPGFAATQSELARSAAVLIVAEKETADLANRARELVAAASGLDGEKISVVLSAPSVVLPDAPVSTEEPIRVPELVGGIGFCAALLVAIVAVFRRASNRKRPFAPQPLRPIGPPPGVEVQ